MVYSLIVNFSGQAVGSAGLGPKLPRSPHVTAASIRKLPITVDTRPSTNTKSCAKAGPVAYQPVLRIICLLCRIFVAPAAYLRIHQGNRLLNGGVYSQVGGIKQVCIFCGLERRCCAILVAFVAL